MLNRHSIGDIAATMADASLSNTSHATYHEVYLGDEEVALTLTLDGKSDTVHQHVAAT